MSSADFRSLADRSSNHPDTLFRAAITAFVSLTRPTRADAIRLYDLAEPLLSMVSAEAQRFAAAALSDSTAAPPALIRAIAALPTAVSAPLLVRSPLLGEIDLIACIGRYGLHHARAISRRADLGPRITALLSSLHDEDIASRFQPPAGKNADDVREKLRSIGLQERMAEPDQHWRSLRDTATTGIPALFQTALADALEAGFATAGQIAAHRPLNAALRGLDLTAERAFLLNCALYPQDSVDAISVRQFIADYEALDRNDVHVWLVRFVVTGPAAMKSDPVTPANTDDANSSRVLKAS